MNNAIDTSRNIDEVIQSNNKSSDHKVKSMPPSFIIRKSGKSIPGLLNIILRVLNDESYNIDFMSMGSGGGISSVFIICSHQKDNSQQSFHKVNKFKEQERLYTLLNKQGIEHIKNYFTLEDLQYNPKSNEIIVEINDKEEYKNIYFSLTLRLHNIPGILYKFTSEFENSCMIEHIVLRPATEKDIRKNNFFLFDLRIRLLAVKNQKNNPPSSNNYYEKLTDIINSSNDIIQKIGNEIIKEIQDKANERIINSLNLVLKSDTPVEITEAFLGIESLSESGSNIQHIQVKKSEN